jgi:hypothetical protein
MSHVCSRILTSSVKHGKSHDNVKSYKYRHRSVRKSTDKQLRNVGG